MLRSTEVQCSLSLIQITIKKHWRSRVGPWGRRREGGRFSLSFLICSLSLIQITIKKLWRSRVGPWGRRRGRVESGGYYLIWVYILYGIPFVLFNMGLIFGVGPRPPRQPPTRGVAGFSPDHGRPVHGRTPGPRPGTWQNSRPQAAQCMAELQAPGRPVHGRTPGPRPWGLEFCHVLGGLGPGVLP